MTKVIQNDYIRFWAPYDGTYEAATSSIQMKSPEFGNSIRLARNQSTVRTRSGTTLVYDRGNNYNNIMSLQFRDITDAQRAQLVTFLTAINWAATKVTYQDMYGTEYVVRITGDNGIIYKDNGLRNRKTSSEILWDFELELLDLTGNIEELNRTDPAVASALTLHISDLNHPHNPEAISTVNISDGAKTIEQQDTNTWGVITWLAVVEKAGARASYIVTATHNRNGVTDATSADKTVLEDVIIGTPPAVTFTVDLSGSGTSQKLNLKAATNTDATTIKLRRVKL